jgi:uncharacterized protein (DUF1697 family)
MPAHQTSSGTLFRYVALLRGINLGGKNKLPMKELAKFFAEAGCSNVGTYIQSGNVIFSATTRLAAQLPDLIVRQIATRFGHRPPIILRTAKQLADVISSNPFLQVGAPEETLHVLFLADSPGAREIANLDPNRSPSDTFIVSGQEIYLRLPNGVAKSKLTNDYFDRILGTKSTGRNWRTVNELFELTQTPIIL